VIGGVISGIVSLYITPWAVDLINGIGDLSDMLDDVTIDSTITLTGQSCSGQYRGKEEWTNLTFNFRGRTKRVPPNRLPGVDAIAPDDFNATFACGQLYIDRHRIQQKLGGLVQLLLDDVATEIAGFGSIEGALEGMIDCPSIAYDVDDYVYSACTFCPSVYGIVEDGCYLVVDNIIGNLSNMLVSAANDLSLLKRKGVATVSPDGRMLSQGIWFGSLIGADFPGEFTATRQ
jgi:hypothetical protein